MTTGFSGANTALFDGLDRSALDDVARSMRVRHVAAGATVCRTGDPTDGLFVLRHGLVHVVAEPGQTVLARQRPGDVVGEIALLTGEPRSATLVARVPSEVLELSRASFLSLAERFPRLLQNLARILADRLAARTAGRGHQGHPEVVVVIVDRHVVPQPGAMLAAAQAASPGPVSAIDLTGADALATAEALEQLERLLRDHHSVLIFVPPGRDDLPLLLDYADRSEVVEPGTDVAWLGRHLTRAKLGLALGAGGAKGFAHVAAIRALGQAGYTIDYVAGSSIGAWVATWLALGCDADTIERRLRTTFSTENVDTMFRRGTTADSSGLDMMRRLATEATGGAAFEDLTMQLTVLTADLEHRRPAPITTGPLDEALVAATTVPGLYPPVEVGSQRLVDATVLTPVPSEAVADAGADVTIAVNLLGRATLSSWPDGTDVAVRTGGTRDTLIESFELAQIGASALQTARADVGITPVFGPGTWRHFHLAEQYLAAGADAAEAALPALRARVRPQRLAS